MGINATFIVQIINFWISYAMLHKLLFKPFIRLIEKKNTAKAALLDGLKAKEQTLLLLQEDKKLQLENFKKHLKAQYQEPQGGPLNVPPPATFTRDQKELDSLTETTKALLIKKAPHAY